MSVKWRLNLTGVKFRRLTYWDLARVKWINEQCLPENYLWRTWFSLYRAYKDISWVAVDEKSDLAIAYCMNKLDEGWSFWDRSRWVKKGHVFSVATLPQWRRRGIATALLALSFESMFDKGCQEIFLEVRVSNTPAIRLYSSRFKMQVVMRVPRYYHDGEDAYVMAVRREDVEDDIRLLTRWLRDQGLVESAED